ncbi:PAS domain-containing protein [Haloarchaeobius sp. TZWWS8]|uniref:PAS domain-containing protein n=1 Tax=Haloarchaeobius sp. TZWWS8 TaxID=3446121 RepID=UPI003EB8E53C
MTKRPPKTSLHELVKRLSDGGGLLTDVQHDPIRVLHVDDESAFSDLFSRFLAPPRGEFDVVCVESADEALTLLDHDGIDCIVSDYRMPRVDGLEFLLRVREQYPDLPFILYTGQGSEDVASDAIAAGVTGYLQKGSGVEQYELLANRIEHAVARHRAERSAKRSFRALETASEGIAILAEDGTYLYVNEAYAALYGYRRRDLVGGRFDVLADPNEPVTVPFELLSVAKRRRWEGPVVHRRADDSLVEVELSVVYNEEERSFICTAHERTEAEVLAEDLSLKERAMDAAPIGIVITDSHQRDEPIIYTNEGFTRLTGYEERDILGRNCRFLQGPESDPATVARLREAIEARRAESVVLLNYRADGTTFWNRISIAPIQSGDDVTHFVGFQQDVTDLVEAQETVAEQAAELTTARREAENREE